MNTSSRGSKLFAAPLAIYTSIILIYFLSGADLYVGAIGALPLPPTQLFVVAFAVPLGISLLKDLLTKRPLSRVIKVFKGNSLIITSFLIVVSIALSLAMLPNANWSSGGKFISFFVFDFLVYVVGCMLPLIPYVRKNYRWIILGAMIALIYSMGYDVLVPGTFSDTRSRAAGFAGNSNFSSLLMNLMCAAALTYRLESRRFDTLVLLTGGLGVFLTLSRSGMLGFAIVVSCYSLFVFLGAGGSLKRSLSFLAGAFVFVSLIAIIVPVIVQNTELMATPRAQARLEMLFGGGGFMRSEESRLRVVFGALEVVNKAPFLGQGTGHSRGWHTGTHNIYLQQWVNNGLLGLAAYLALLFVSFFTFRRRKFAAGQVLLCVATLGGLFSHNVLDLRCFLLLFGMLSTLSLWRQENETQELVAHSHFELNDQPVARPARKRVQVVAKEEDLLALP